ncbi:helix-turn-helix domain-containing protein [Mycobacterium sp. M1]|uniref:Helix-turn-helix domain-containing protein n=1 Tax=Mycolicibacter acidiphilus TaxID=2835306 RepID=A0ABS5RFN4_9MYCO|nr:helix-turn-helix domain-containing protein [Mycolicibacter acidiphilus]MBS9532403.1 helix-turn-helix domain-containing protein [Mycolicibacter acidiphilus]
MDIEKLAVRLALVIAEAQAETPELEKPKVPVLFTVPEATEHLRCAESTVWQLLRNGELGSVRVGRRRLIPADAITDYLAGPGAA